MLQALAKGLCIGLSEWLRTAGARIVAVVDSGVEKVSVVHAELVVNCTRL